MRFPIRRFKKVVKLLFWKDPLLRYLIWGCYHFPHWNVFQITFRSVIDALREQFIFPSPNFLNVHLCRVCRQLSSTMLNLWSQAQWRSHTLPLRQLSVRGPNMRTRRCPNASGTPLWWTPHLSSAPHTQKRENLSSVQACMRTAMHAEPLHTPAPPYPEDHLCCEGKMVWMRASIFLFLNFPLTSFLLTIKYWSLS